MHPVLVDDVAARYAAFAAHEAAGHSDVFVAWASGVADDAEICDLIGTLPPRERQPNLVFAVARAVSPDVVSAEQQHARPDEYARLREVLVTKWDRVRALTATRHTQTNEAARIAALLPVLHTIHRRCGKPLALVELGASAGLVLHPRAWAYRYTDAEGGVLQQFGPSAPTGRLDVTVTSSRPEVPQAMPDIDWRVGVDLNPLDATDPDVADWLRLLVWPGQVRRLARLEAALEAARTDPVRVVPRDITAPGVVDEMVALVPTDLHPVVFHCAVQAYLDGEARAQLSQHLLERSGSGSLSWVSFEGTTVVPQVEQGLSDEDRAGLVPGAFIVALDGRLQYQADGHAGWIG